jgi:hypothetical protein
MFKLSRLFIIYALAVPLALYLGYLVVSPDRFTFGFIALLLFIFALPLFLKWHHVLLIVFWNSVFNAAFLPGTPDFWLLLAVISFCISFLNHIMFRKTFLKAPELTVPLLFFTVVVLVTAEIRGGIGIRALGGSSYGGRYYILVLGAVAGYFAFTSEAIPLAKGQRMGEIFLGSGATFALSNILYTLGPAFYIFYIIVPAGAAMSQAASDMGMTDIARLTGVAPACVAGLCFLLARFGIRGIFDFNRPWRFLFLCLTIVVAFFAGFRSIMVILFLIFAVQFYLEGLLRTHYFPIVAGLAICGLTPILLFSNSMPAAVQRAISFLPVNVDSEILADAKGSTEWRVGMWTAVSREIPQYLIIGKGFSINPDELFSVVEAGRMGLQTADYEGSMLAGDYHSGPLSVLIPFGIFGMIGFLWILYGGYRVLSMNLRYGDPRLRRINTVLLAFYISYCISFIFIFGALQSQLPTFLGACGMSVSLNGGVKRRIPMKRAPAAAAPRSLVMEAG